jgi:ankyrin repeat protein
LRRFGPVSAIVASLVSLSLFASAAPEDGVPSNPKPAISYDAGSSAYDLGQFETAITIWLQAAALGDIRSLIRIGDEYTAGAHLPKLPLAAAYYYSVAAKLGGNLAPPVIDRAKKGLTSGQIRELEQSVATYKPLVPPSPAAGAPTEQLTGHDLVYAVMEGDIALAKRALAAGFSPNVTDQRGWTPLHYAALNGDAALVDALIAAKASLDQTDDDGIAPIHVAAFVGSLEIATKLVNAGAHAVATTETNLNAADIARYGKNAELAKYLSDAVAADVAAMQAKLNQLGYDVGEPDGTLNNRTREQVAIFANRIGVRPTYIPTAQIVRNIFLTTRTSVWGYGLQLTKDGDIYYANATGAHAESASEAANAAMEWCAEQGGTNCKVLFVAPQGSCVAYAQTRPIWSPILWSQFTAEEAATDKCARAGGRCQIASFCVGQ